MTAPFTINQRNVELAFDEGATLLELLRDNGWTEVKQGCSHGECGSCIVLLNGQPVNACQVYAAAAVSGTIVTSRGIITGDEDPILRAFVETGSVQCGFCTPGIVVSTYALLRDTPDPTDEDVRVALGGNVCRCTGYVKQIEAVRRAAEMREREGRS